MNAPRNAASVETNEEKTIQQEIVEAVYPHASWGKCVTEGFMRSCLELVGVKARGVSFGNTPAQQHTRLVRLCVENGLPFKETGEEKGEDTNRR